MAHQKFEIFQDWEKVTGATTPNSRMILSLAQFPLGFLSLTRQNGQKVWIGDFSKRFSLFQFHASQNNLEFMCNNISPKF